VPTTARVEPAGEESPRWRRWLATDRPWPIAVAGLVGLVLCFWSPWRAIELKGFDTLTVLTAPGQAALPITLIAIDEESMGAIAQQWPWPRGVHARLLDRLKEAGVAIAAFDVVFSEPDREPAQDEAFARSIREFGAPVVLAANLEYRDTRTPASGRVRPAQAVIDAGAARASPPCASTPMGCCAACHSRRARSGSPS
jgi:adenylate cyclase